MVVIKFYEDIFKRYKGKNETKSLCKLVKKDVVKDDFSSYSLIVDNGSYVCLKCVRVANMKKNHCKVKKL